MSIRKKLIIFLLISLFLFVALSVVFLSELKTHELAISVFLLIILGFIFYFMVEKLVLKRIDNLANEIKEIKAGKKEEIKISGKDEITSLFRELNSYINNLKEEISKIEENRKIYETIAEKSEEIIILFNIQGDIIYANPKALEYFGDREFRISKETLPAFIKDFLISCKEDMNFWHEITLPEGTCLSAWIIPLEGKSETLILIAHDITFFKKEKDKLFEIATKDALTSLYNRNFLKDFIKKAIEATKRGKSYSLLFIDMDDLKKINDQFGHIVGDTAIRAVSDVIIKNLRASEIAARWGGDEFVIVINGGKEASKVVAERIQNNLRKIKLSIGQHSFSPSVSIGITTVEPADTIDTLIKKADKAAYEAKKKGKGGIEFSP